MFANDKISVITISENILKNASADINSSFYVSYFNDLGYDVSKLVVIPPDLKMIINEIRASNNHYDLTMLIGNLSNGYIHQALGKVLKKSLVRNEQLEQKLADKNIIFNDEEVLTPSCLSSLEGDNYPLLHVNRIFVIHETYRENIFESVLETYLNNFKRCVPFKKISTVCLNGNDGELENLKLGVVKFELKSKNSNTAQLEYSSESLEELLGFEDEVRRLVFVTSSKYVLDNFVYSDPSLHIKTAIQVIEKCFKEYTPQNTMVSFNGGKDCTVLLHLMMSVLEKYHPCKCQNQKPICLYVQGAQPFPNQEDFINKCQRLFDLNIVKLQMNMKDALKTVLKDHPNLKACLMGTRKTDPYSNELSHFQMTDRGYPEIMRVNPILNWNYHQVWDYLLYYKVPYCELYDMGYTSLGDTDNTIRNADLSYKDDLDEEEKYYPAYKLLNEQSERVGRIRKS